MTNEINIEDMFRKAHNGDKEAREVLINNNYGLVIKIVKGYNRDKFNHEVLTQEGLIGLIKAVDRFDPSRGLAFSTYAYYLIKGQIQRYIRDDCDENVFRLKRTDIYTYKKILEARRILSQEFNNEPTTREISILINEEEKEVEGIINILENTVSMTHAKYYSKNSPNSISIEDGLSNEINVEEEVINKISIHQALKKLTETQREIIRLRYFENCTQAQVGKILNTNQAQISRHEKKALKIMKGALIWEKS